MIHWEKTLGRALQTYSLLDRIYWLGSISLNRLRLAYLVDETGAINLSSALAPPQSLALLKMRRPVLHDMSSLQKTLVHPRPPLPYVGYSRCFHSSAR